MENNQIENKSERILTREEVASKIESYVENPKVERELFDEKGKLYLLEVRKEGEKPGEFTEYTYQRKGQFGRNITSDTQIYVTYYEEEQPVTGSNIAHYNEETGEWENIK